MEEAPLDCSGAIALANFAVSLERLADFWKNARAVRSGLVRGQMRGSVPVRSKALR